MTHSVRLRIASFDDADKITDVINFAFRRAEEFFVNGDRIDVEKVLDFLRTGKFLVAEENGILIGCVYVEPRGDRAYLGLLSVDPSRQQAGLGSLLMAEGEKYCRGLDCRFMDIKIVNLREELQGFYQSRGYVETGTSPFPADVETELPCHFIDMSKPLGTREHESH
jgi:N-acetylglutamate synthase-like GNAT family acetyltransferase